jgi:hypothetical protein
MKLHTAMFVRKFAFTIVVLANLASAMNTDPTRQIVYEKCRGPGEF